MLLLTNYVLICLSSVSPTSALKWQLHEGKDFCFLLYSQWQGQSLVPCRKSVSDECHGMKGLLVPSLDDFSPGTYLFSFPSAALWGWRRVKTRRTIKPLDSCRSDAFKGYFFWIQKFTKYTNIEMHSFFHLLLSLLPSSCVKCIQSISQKWLGQIEERPQIDK